MSARWRSEILQELTLFRSTEHLRVSKSLDALGSRFFAAPWYTALDSTLKTFVQILRRLIIYFETAQQQPSIVLPTDNDLFLVFEHQLLSAVYETGTTLLQEPLRLSLLIYLNLRIWHFQAFPFMQFMVEALRRSLVPAYGHVQSTAPDLLFWILFIGGMASQGYKCHPWLVSRLTDMARRLNLVEWKEARETLGGFFYTDQPGERGAENLWNEVLLMESCKYLYDLDLSMRLTLWQTRTSPQNRHTKSSCYDALRREPLVCSEELQDNRMDNIAVLVVRSFGSLLKTTSEERDHETKHATDEVRYRIPAFLLFFCSSFAHLPTRGLKAPPKEEHRPPWPKKKERKKEQQNKTI
jgi:hypothetical protein